jgi:ATP-binding protein involved in chromosome partitioning
VKPIVVPQAIHRSGRTVDITWGPGHVGVYPARELRLKCHCAVCREEMTGRALLDPATVPADVTAARIDLVGGYAIRVAWSDGHDTGMYPYDYLLALCPCEDCGAKRAGGQAGK